MNRPTLTVVLIALAIFVVAIVGATAFGGAEGGKGVHTMPDGRTMEGEMR